MYTLYNNTISGFDTNIYSYWSTILAKNNICQNSQTYCYESNNGTVHVDSTNNLSERADAPGDDPVNSATVLFLDEVNYNFHLTGNDSSALGGGVNLSSDSYLQVSSDIDGEDRSNWCIGADEFLNTLYKFKGNSLIKGHINFK